MAEPTAQREDADERPWGGSWTEVKLNVLRSYLSPYLTALKNQRQYFRLEYIDAFAGAGYRRLPGSLSPDLFTPSSEEVAAFRDGSARIALSLDSGFDAYTFIEKSKRNVAQLEKLAASFRERDVRILQGEANQRLQELASLDWRKRRAVVFVDPFGMQLEWPTLEALAQTKAVDVWILVPIGIALNRLLARRLSDIPPGWARRLDRFFGTRDWRTGLYESTEVLKVRKGEIPMFPEERSRDQEREKVVNFDDIARYYLARLRKVFPHVAQHYKSLRNSTGQPIYMLCFAAANPNPKAGGLALRIANHLLKS